MIKAVFFDAIKTIFCPYPNETELYRRVIRDITGRELTSEKVRTILDRALSETEKMASANHTKTQKWEYFPKMVTELAGCTESECDSYAEKLKYETWGNPANYRLYDDVLPALEMLQNQDYRIACVSNEDGWLYNFFVHFGIDQYFEFVLTSQEVGCEKPRKQIFEKALGLSKLSADEVLFVGDSYQSDFVGARNTGMEAILIDREGKINENSAVKVNDLRKIMEHLNG